MTREMLEAMGLSKEQIDEIMAENGKDIEKAKGDLSTKETELADTKKLLEDANTKITDFETMDIEKIKQEAKDYKEAFEKADREGKEKLEALQYETALKDYMGTHKFASDRIKNSIYNDMKSKEFKLEEGKFLGADDYIKLLQEKEPESFVSEETNPATPPNFTRPASKDKTDEPESLGARLARQNLENQ